MGCKQEPENSASPDHNQKIEHHQHTDHDHAHLISVSDNSDIELEFLSSDKHSRLELNVLDSKTHKPFAIDAKKIQATFQTADQEIPVSLLPAPRTDDPNQMTSQFVIPFADLPQQLKLLNEFQVTFQVELNGKSVTGKLDHRNDHQHHHES